MARIEQFLRSHAAWLQEQLRKKQEARDWFDGMPLPYLGGELRLAWRPSANLRRVEVEGGALRCLASRDDLEAAVVDWYRDQALNVLAERLALVSVSLGRHVPPWRLSDARTRWGSLSAQGVVNLNWRLVKAAPEVIDYVICHELAHFRRRDHSAAFWREVASLCPEYVEMRDRLRHDGHRYLEF